MIEPFTVITLADGLVLAFFNSGMTESFIMTQVAGRLQIQDTFNDGAGNIVSFVRDAVQLKLSRSVGINTAYVDLPSGSLVDIAGLQVKLQGKVAVGNFTSTARLHLNAGGATAENAPFKYTAGVVLTAPETGAKEYDGTNEFITVGAVRYTIAKTLTATAALDFPSTAAQTSSDLTIAVTGAALGDVVTLGIPFASVNANSGYEAFVSAAGTVTVRFNNYSAAAIDPASGTFRVSILKY